MASKREGRKNKRGARGDPAGSEAQLAYEMVERKRKELEDLRREEAKGYIAPTWDQKELAEAWDEVFQELSDDPDYAEELVEYAAENYEKLGRGVIFVRADVKSRPPVKSMIGKKPEEGGLGFFDHPEYGEVVAISPTLLLTSMDHDYVTVEELKGVFEKKEGAGARLNNDVISALRKTCRNLDLSRVLTLSGPSSSSEYDPSLDEMVLLLTAEMDGAPAVGVDLVRAVEENNGEMRLVSPALEEFMARLDVDDFLNDDDD